MSDADYASVSILLLGDGTNGSTTFTDSGPIGHTVTAVGNAQVSTSSPKFGSGSILLDGTGDYLTVPGHVSTAFPGVFTWDFWFKHSSASARGCVIGHANNPRGATNYQVEFNPESNNNFRIYVDSGSDYLTDFTDSSLSDGNWHHMAITRDSINDLRIYYDGVHKALQNFSGTFGNATDGFWIGDYIIIPTFADYAGNIDCFRMTKGVARWTGTSSFSPPTSEDDYLPAAGINTRLIGGRLSRGGILIGGTLA